MGVMAVFFLSCASTRINQFGQFASVGRAYSDAARTVLSEAGDLVIDESSDRLMRIRDGLTQKERGEMIIEYNQSDMEFLTIFNDIFRHTTLLGDYFEALKAFTENDDPADAGNSARAAYTALARIHPEVKAKKFGESAIGDYLDPVITLTVGQLKHTLLEEELRKRGQLIERELALQSAAMKAVSEMMQSRVENILISREAVTIAFAYMGEPGSPDKKLPGTWARKRREILKASASMESLNEAAKTAEKLRQTYIKLVQNDLDKEELEFLVQDLEGIIEIIKLFSD